MAKKQTPGKGGAKGMHHGHVYKETCGCAICKSKRKKMQLGEVITDPGEPDKVVVRDAPTFERADTIEDYIAKITFKGINYNNCKGVFDHEKGHMVFHVEGFAPKIFECKDNDVNEAGTNIISSFSEDTLTVCIPRKQVPLTTETLNQFPQGEPIEIKRNEQTENKTAPEKTADATTNQSKQTGNEDVSKQSETPTQKTSLSGEITITEETYGVMNANLFKLVKAFGLKGGYGHAKFMNDLANRAIVFYCNNLK